MRPGTAERAYEALRLHEEGHSYRKIAALMECSAMTAYELAEKARTELAARPSPGEKAASVRRLDRMAVEAWAVLRRTHWVVDRGHVVTYEGAPLVDDAPIISALNVLLKVELRRAKLLGLDAPTRSEVITVDQIDAELARLTHALGEDHPPA